MFLQRPVMVSQRDRLYLLISVQFVVIALLLESLSNEYLSNAYMRTWIADNVPLLGILLHGEVGGLSTGVAIGVTIILIAQILTETKAEPSPKATVKPVLSPYPTTLPRPGQESQLPWPDPLPDRPEDIMRELEKQDQ